MANLNAKFRTGPLEHNVLAGIETSLEDRDQSGPIWSTPSAHQRCQSESLHLGPARSDIDIDRINAMAIGYYVQDQIKVTDWLELLGGLRFDNFTAKSTAYTAVSTATGALGPSTSI